MGDYYYNEKKGRYEPVNQAPFGVKPKEKRSRKVFTAEGYSQKKPQDSSRQYTSIDDDQRYRSLTSPVEKVVNSLADAISDAVENSSGGGSSSSSQNRTYNSSTTSNSGGGGKTTSNKGKAGVGALVLFVWIFFMMVKSCFE